MNKNKVSVVMATYNGEKYIRQQIESILLNLNVDDEIIVSDDNSTDNTVKMVEDFNDSRIKIIEGPRKGVKKNFENAIKNATGDIIFLSDQDDIWTRDKVSTIKEDFNNNPNVMLVIHDAEVFDDATGEILFESFGNHLNMRNGVIKNIIKNTYIGCCMAFKKEIVNKIIPIPENIEMHDQWIGIVNDLFYEKSYFETKKLIRYRRHSNNASRLTHYPIIVMIKKRVVFTYELIKRILR